MDLLCSISVPNVAPNSVSNSVPNWASEIQMFFDPFQCQNQCPKYECSRKQIGISVYFKSLGLVNHLDSLCPLRCGTRYLIRLRMWCPIFECPSVQFGAKIGLQNKIEFRFDLKV